jgi:hypothetical protein
MPPTRPLPTPQLSLPERIAALRAEIDLVIDQMANDEAKRCPGVPEVVVRQMITRGSSCQCRSYLIHTGVLK